MCYNKHRKAEQKLCCLGEEKEPSRCSKVKNSWKINGKVERDKRKMIFRTNFLSSGHEDSNGS